MVRARLWLLLGAACVALLVVPGSAAAQQGVTINMATGPNRFEPAEVTVPVGTRVTWMLVSGGHSTTSETGLWDSGVLTQGSFSHTFTQPGTYGFYCIPHRDRGMVGTITVAGAQTPSTTPRTGDADGMYAAVLAALAAGGLLMALGLGLRRRSASS